LVPDPIDILPPRYRDPQPIGRGGMGEIYRAGDETLGRRVAIKILAERYSRDESVRGRFKREALSAARLSSEPNVIDIYDVGEWNDRPFIVMEYLPGGSLEDVLVGEGAQEAGRALAWLDQAARALDAAHANGVVHRDVKPANLLLDREGDVRVADFGIATAVGLDSMTRTGTVLGTAGYLAPEQALGERAAPASDRYALGVVAFELLTGTRPFAGDTPAVEASAHVHAPVPSASSRRPDLPPQVDAVFRRALAKDPAERHSSCAELVADLRRALSEAAGTTWEQVVATPPPRRDRAWWPLLAAGLLAAAIAGIAAAALLTGDEEKAAQPAQPRTVVTTEPGPTVVQTETVTTPPPQEEGKSGADLNDEGFALMEEGRYEEALPRLEEAVRKLSGTGERVEAFALYNLAFTKLQLGRCGEDIPQMLDRSEEIQGHRGDIDKARKQYEEQCGG